MRKYWSRWNKCWETTFGFQSTQGAESWHWSIKGPLHGKVLRANQLPQYLHDVFIKKESRRIKKVYTVDEPIRNSKPDNRDLDRQFYNVFGGVNNPNIRIITSVFNDTGTIFSFFFTLYFLVIQCSFKCTLYNNGIHCIC
jgi:hypothetical protein